jgi:HIRAN domain
MLQAIHRALFGDTYSVPAADATADTKKRVESVQAMAVISDWEPTYFRAGRASADAEPPSSAKPTRLAQSTAPSATSRPDQQSRVILDLGSATSDCHLNIVSESHYQDRLRRVSSLGRSFTVVMMPEPTNVFDPNAIRVVAEGADTIGYFSREDAASYAPVFKMLARHDCAGTCRARLTRGTGEKRSFDVLLNLRDASDLLISLRNALEPASRVEANAEAF